MFEAQIEELQRQLAHYESGWRSYDRQGRETTACRIDGINREIAEYERVSASRPADDA
jgi:hypothetical protein